MRAGVEAPRAAPGGQAGRSACGWGSAAARPCGCGGIA